MNDRHNTLIYTPQFLYNSTPFLWLNYINEPD
jgi:hypothetical protein